MGTHDTPPASPTFSPDADEVDDDDIEEVIDLPENEEIPMNSDDDDGDDADYEVAEDDTKATDMAEVTFTQHKGSVFCCAIDTKAIYAVTGGEDDQAYIWSVITGELYLHCINHKESVAHVCFSHDDQLVATGDMSGYIQVWKLTSRAKVWDFELGDLSWLQWHPLSHVLLAGVSDGTMWMWKIPQGDTKTFPGFNAQIECGKVYADGKKAVVGYSDGSVRLFDLKSGNTLQSMAGSTGHSSCITTIDASNGLIVAGAVDGTARLFSSNSGKLLGILACSDEGSTRRQNVDEDEDASMLESVESVSLCRSNTSLLATATLQGKLSVWDVASQTERHVCRLGTGIVKLLWDPSAPLIYAAGLDGTVRLCDARTGAQVSQWTGHTADILDCAISMDGSVMVTASDDSTSKIFVLSSPDR